MKNLQDVEAFLKKSKKLFLSTGRKFESLQEEFSRNWYQQIDKHESIKWTFSQRIDSKHYHTCSICHKNYTGISKDFHHNHSHKGGYRCPRCTFVSFDYQNKANHKCSPPKSIYSIKGQTAVLVTGREVAKVYAIPLIHPKRKILWLGTTTLKTAIKAAHLQMKQSLAAKKKEFIKRGKSTGCSLFCKKLWPTRKKARQYSADSNNAFFFKRKRRHK